MSDIAIVLTILFITIGLLAWGRFAAEGVAVIAALALFATGLIDEGVLLAGFANSAIIAIAGLLVLGNALERAGVIRAIADFLQKMVRKSETRLMLTSTIAPGLLSGIINIVAAVSVFIPVLMRVALKTDVQPRRLLLPMAYVAMAGATLTLIGASHNLIVNDMLKQQTGESLDFFTITPLGLILVVIAVVYSLLVSRWLLSSPKENDAAKKNQTRHLIQRYAMHERIWEVKVLQDHKDETSFPRHHGITLVAVIRQHGERPFVENEMTFHVGDTLLISGRQERVQQMTEQAAWLEIQGAPASREDFSAGDSELVEIMVPAHSEIIGRSVESLALRKKHGLNCISIWRNDKPIRTDVDEVTLQAGDALLLYGQKRFTRAFDVKPDFLWLQESSKTSVTAPAQQKAHWIVLIFVGVILAAVLKVVPISMAALGGAVLVVAIGAMSPKAAFDAIQWPTLLLIAAMLAFGPALQDSGTSAWLADKISTYLEAYGSYAILAAIAIVTFFLTQALHSAAAAIIMTPVALDVAEKMQYAPLPLAVIVLLSAAFSLMLPVGHPAPLLVQKPGCYRISDYVQFGSGLGVLVLIAIIFLTPWFFPLTA